MSQLMDHLKDEVVTFLNDSGRNAQQFMDKIEFFLNKIEPDVDAAVAAGDTMSLGYLRDRVVGETSRVSLGVINQERRGVVAVVMAVVRTAVKFGLAAA